MSRKQLTVVALMIGLGLSGCVSDPAPAPTGDGSVAGTEFLTDAKGDGKPYLDVVGGRFVETPAALIAEIRVTDFDPTKIGALAATDGYSWGFIQMCWDRPAARPGATLLRGEQCAGVAFEPLAGSPPTGFYETSLGPGENCNDWYWCAWHVPFEVVAGSPTTVRVVVPRELLANDSVGYTLDGPFVEGVGLRPDPSHPSAMTGRWAYAFGCVPARCVTQSVASPVQVDRDQSNRGPDHHLTLTTQGTLGTPSPRTLIVDQIRDIETPTEGYRADLDVLSVDMEETATGFSYVTKVASLPATAAHEYDMEFAAAGTTYEAWYSAVGGQVHDALGGYCADPDCNTWKEIKPEVRLTPGTPGTIRVTLKWADLLPAPKRTLVTLAEVELGETRAYKFQTTPAGYAAAGSFGMWDGNYFAEPYFLAIGSPT